MSRADATPDESPFRRSEETASETETLTCKPSPRKFRKKRIKDIFFILIVRYRQLRKLMSWRDMSMETAADYERLAQQYKEEGKWDDAIDAYRKALQLEPQNACF
jgi:tetratricopeptide (TPR) repeat protein